MIKIFLAALLLAIVFVGDQTVSASAQVVMDPLGPEVGTYEDITGRVSERATVWVIVQPLASGGLWAHGPARVEGDKWSVSVQFGEPQRHLGAEYRVGAIADPTSPLERGPIGEWPSCQWQSQVVRVTKNHQ